jgi:predicted ATPase
VARADRRRFGAGPYVLSARLRSAGDGWPFDLPAVRALESLRFDAPVTFLVGDNGTGKSTLVEALAWALGFDADGGTTGIEMDVPNRGHNELGSVLDLELTRFKPREGFYLRAESFLRVVEKIDRHDLAEVYGADAFSFHAQSHGETFLTLASNRFGGESLFVLDEPEAALSVTSALAFLGVMHRAVEGGSQFVVATHSPILLAFPGARIYELGEDGASEVGWDECDPTRMMKAFLHAPERFLREIGV